MGQGGNPGQACGPFGRAGTRFADNGLVSKVQLSRIPGVRNVWKVAIPALLVLGMAGCETVSRSPAPLTTVVVPEPFAIAPPAPLEEPAPVAPAIVVTSAPPALVSPLLWPSNWVNAWIPLESWGKLNGLAHWQQISANPHPTYQWHTSNGVVAVKVGSRIAFCGGLACWLGFPPQLINGLPYIHSLDALKNLQPVVSLPHLRLKVGRTICIDPGHGGKDVGAKSSVNNDREKDYTLDWAWRLRPLLAANGWNVVLTRTSDVDVSLAERVSIAERANADLFLSLHFNSGEANHDLAGLETYCLTPVGMPSNLVRTYEDDPRQVFPNNAFDEQNYQWAYQLHRALVQALGASDRGVRHARFMGVLRGQTRPAVLIEAGYLSNPAEARKIASAAYRQSLAEAVAKGVE